ncbi:copper chaperone PCu(A)C [Streptomyces sp. NPDC003703]|uniref:copper chaperone PCu(A)C n=1 Tax=Streptomyces sp. NPDC003283 TaxID=3364681 RepID=UPI0036A3996B
MSVSAPGTASAATTVRRLRASALAAAAPVAACLVALGALTLWTTLGCAGSPPDLGVTRARVFRPTGGTPDTAAFFRITNQGGAADELVEVTAPSVPDGIALSRHRMTPDGAAYRDPADRLSVPARGTLDMSPLSSDVTVPANPKWRVGDRVWFELRFAHSGTVRVRARVVRPGPLD